MGVSHRCVMGRCKQQEFVINKTLGSSASFQALSPENSVFTCEFSPLFHFWDSADSKSTPDCC